jgi:simple sugar transport system ATP-binding protein
VSFQFRGGEIVGIAGVAGNGQTELIEALAGLRPVDAGRVTLQDVEVTNASVAEHRQAGLAYVPEDRGQVGAALGASVAENLAMGFQTRPPISRQGLLTLSGMRRFAEDLIQRYGIKVSRPAAPAASLSGGNLQKVTLARELSHDAPCLIVEQPTRGLDIGAIEFVHQQLLHYRAQGHAILLVSAELSEILALSDRVLVMLEGRIVGEVPGAEATETGLGMLMTGAHETVTSRAVGSST